ncbi:transporter [bacterium]|nr:transporter [bacterium]
MMTRRMPALLALPAMAVSIAAVSGSFYDWSAVPADASGPKNCYDFLMVSVFSEGPARLANAIMYAAFGSVLSQVVMRTGIAARLISLTAEYAGESKYRLAALMTIMVAVCFTSVTGLGAVIMIGSLVLPILVGAGISSGYAACLMLFAIAWGGIFNPAVLGFYVDTLKIDQNTMRSYVLAYGILMGLTTLLFFAIQGWRERKSFNWSAPMPAPTPSNVPILALLTPILPIALILIFNMPIIPAFVIGMLWGVLTASGGSPINVLTAAILEGLKDIAPVLGLFVGIGMALNAMMAEPTKAVLAPFLQAVVPTSPLGFVLFFSLLAPLALYRGPLNFYGLGAGIAGLLFGAQMLPNTAIMAAFFSTGQLQGVSDPTNTHNVWLGQFAKVSTWDLLRQTLPYVWGFSIVALLWSVFFMGALK